MDTIPDSKLVIQPLQKVGFLSRVAAVDVLRLDLLHPVISGNKWYKLHYNLQQALQLGYDTLLTFGGGFSNHLIATACAASKAGLHSIAVVRGNYDTLTPTLQACVQEGMQLHFVNKAEYDNLQLPENAAALQQQLGRAFVVPEGGANDLGRKGASLIARHIPATYTHVAVSVGSGTTLAGLREALPHNQYVLGFAPMKGGGYLKQEIEPLLSLAQNKYWDVLDNWHLGGFGKFKPELISFMNDFYNTHNIPLDIIYTAKMMSGITDLLALQYFSATDSILCIHTGGLQGNVMVKDKLVF